MGNGLGPMSYLLTYSLKHKTITKSFNNKKSESKILNKSESFFKHIALIMNEANVDESRIHWESETEESSTQLHFAGGLIGYVGYEMKSESLKHSKQPDFNTKSAKNTPDSSFLFADRIIVFDHELKRMYLVVVYNDSNLPEQTDWINQTCNNINKIDSLSLYKKEPHPIITHYSTMKPSHDRETYIRNINQSLSKINEGETYEVCLTTQLSAPLKLNECLPSPYKMYQHLRKNNPAPYGAFLSFRDTVVASSSPERFMHIGKDGWITMKPIKGTLSRATASNFTGTQIEMEEENKIRVKNLANSEKDSAENLMVFYNFFILDC
jgi:para-aminobenzoate synthetase